jgi:tRNA splicing ligase
MNDQHPITYFLKKKRRYKERFLIVAEEVKSAIVALHNTREQEKMLHKLAVEGVLKRRDNEGRVLCRTLHKKKKKVFKLSYIYIYIMNRKLLWLWII